MSPPGGLTPIQDSSADGVQKPPAKLGSHLHPPTPNFTSQQLGSDPNYFLPGGLTPIQDRSADGVQKPPAKLGSDPDLLQRIEELLSHIPDPEIPVVSIRELGILREVSLVNGVVQVVITPTYSGCPAMGQIEADVRQALAGAGIAAQVTTRLAPAWTTAWMSDATRAKLRAFGIAPPHVQDADSQRPIGFAQRAQAADAVPCPQCGSRNTTETSHFGSTACKSLWKCLDCLEPFDHFKPY